jgi:hypothetical protein
LLVSPGPEATRLQKSGYRAQPLTHLALLFLHAQCFRPAAFMIIATEMQHSMDQQRDELFFQRPACRVGLTLSCRKGDHDITQMRRSLMKSVGRTRLPKGKGQNVGAAIFMTKPVIQPPHPAIAYERDIHVSGRLPDEGKNVLRQSQDLPASDSEGPDRDVKGNGH